MPPGVTEPRPNPDQTIIAELRAQIAAMTVRAAELSADLDRVRADVDLARSERGQERDRADALVSQIADLAREMAQGAEAASERERVLQDRLTAAGAEAHAERLRPWWRRLVG